MFDLTLSFDNGPEPAATPAVLDCLARHGLKASFFVVGEKLDRPGARALVERAQAEGHWIGNHTWTHSVPLGQRREPGVAEAEIGRTQAALGRLSHPQRYFRPFGGGGKIGPHLLSPAVVDYLGKGGFTCVLWNAIPRDWADPEGWVETALRQCASQAWTLLVLHDLPTGAMRQLDRFLDQVQDRGSRIRQDFPPDCLPIVEGRTVRPLDAYVAVAA